VIDFKKMHGENMKLPYHSFIYNVEKLVNIN